ncbi:glycoside hydrolase family 99-like domain-containing protein [Haloferula sp. A504]|uniref:glycoside hydrolase family 99-like domain-containing protein n=1 Tax=Haloferula sp. A504 TaxID=3373601 RepID=UPI0031C8255B|nr:glycoside hydrolase family 99-like domain-containing protein [Verrucomicrobiaceae bacterium E54]
MKTILHLLLAGLFSSSLASAKTKETPLDPGLPNILLIGDSISGGYQKQVRRALNGKANVVKNQGNAEWTGTGLQKIDSYLGDSKWDIIHFNWGLWDIYGWRYYDEDRSPAAYANRLDQLVTRMEKTGAKLIWATTTPVCPGPEKSMLQRHNREVVITREQQEQYRDAALKVMKRHGVEINDLYTYILPGLKKFSPAADNVHFSGSGCAHLAKKVTATLGKAIEDLPRQKYDVAAYYWPSCHFDERWATFFPDGSQGEWESIRNAKPKFEGHWQPRVPAWGYLMDNDPKAMEKKIDAAVSHGVNVMLFDWYWFENKPLLESALNDGFLKARNSQKMKFYLMWANHDAKTAWDIRRSHDLETIWPGSVDRPTFETVVARVINQYFSQPNYYQIDGKPVFSIYDMNNLIKGLGGVKETVDALDYFRAEVKKAGFPGLHLQMVYWAQVPKIDDSGFASAKGSAANTIKTFKVDSITNYQFVHLARAEADYIKWADKALANWPKWSKQFDIPYFPHVSIGWDNNARFVGKREAVTENVNPEVFKRYLLKAKAYADAHPDQPKLITINAWNEWVEGSYLEPDERFGMGYLEAVREVFGSGEVPRSGAAE